MNKKKVNEQRKGTDMLYMVDVQRLSIRSYRMSVLKDAEEAGGVVNYEYFNYDLPIVKPEVPLISKEDLPVLIEGRFYCSTQTEAQIFIKSQIGM